MEEEVEKEYLAICVTKKSQARVVDQPCDDDEKGHSWYFLPSPSTVPAVGRKARGGAFGWPEDGEAYRAARKGGRSADAKVDESYDLVEVCVKSRTRMRVFDGRCDDEDEGHAWYYLPLTGHVPAVTEKAVRGSFYLFGWGETYRARRGGGKGSQAAIEETSAEDDETYTEPDTEEPTPTESSSSSGNCTTVHFRKSRVRRC
ncbi:hypothetical protein HII36_46000 [Nonomuraea sp. NN258]|uniref:hypothetical protein n=1 Tax=Nonomuraea antri TaxID=2730852 RepID=UPI00156A4289|nr:hypothetical protein [Nonomuraea antri]NRQ39129.1 hypothetical protein [Nonomuraea antri]